MANEYPDDVEEMVLKFKLQHVEEPTKLTRTIIIKREKSKEEIEQEIIENIVGHLIECIITNESEVYIDSCYVKDACDNIKFFCEKFNKHEWVKWINNNLNSIIADRKNILKFPGPHYGCKDKIPEDCQFFFFYNND